MEVSVPLLLPLESFELVSKLQYELSAWDCLNLTLQSVLYLAADRDWQVSTPVEPLTDEYDHVSDTGLQPAIARFRPENVRISVMVDAVMVLKPFATAILASTIIGLEAPTAVCIALMVGATGDPAVVPATMSTFMALGFSLLAVLITLKST